MYFISTKSDGKARICGNCKTWREGDSGTGLCKVREKMWTDCGEDTIMTVADFGCIAWTDKGT